jgi:hypothetical protein
MAYHNISNIGEHGYLACLLKSASRQQFGTATLVNADADNFCQSDKFENGPSSGDTTKVLCELLNFRLW